MKNFRIIITIGIFIVIVILIIFIASWPNVEKISVAVNKAGIVDFDKTIIVRSNDLSVFIQIPPKAVPTNINPKNIRLTRVSAKELFGELIDEKTAVAYRLTPEDIIFRENIKITLIIAFRDLNKIPFLFYNDGNELSALSETIYSLNEDKNEIKLIGGINKFNLVGADIKSGIFNYDIKDNGTGEAGSAPAFNVDVWADPEWRVISSTTRLQYTIAPGTAWQVGMVTINSEENRFEPASIIIPKSFRRIDEKYSINESFKCVDAGSDRLIGSNLEIQFQRANKSVSPLGVNLAYYTTDKISFIINTREFNCHEK